MRNQVTTRTTVSRTNRNSVWSVMTVGWSLAVTYDPNPFHLTRYLTVDPTRFLSTKASTSYSWSSENDYKESDMKNITGENIGTLVSVLTRLIFFKFSDETFCNFFDFWCGFPWVFFGRLWPFDQIMIDSTNPLAILDGNNDIRISMRTRTKSAVYFKLQFRVTLL